MNERDKILTDLFHRYGTSIHRMCYLYLRDYHLAEDTVSDTFLRAYRALPSFRREAAARTWLVRIAINVCKSRLRSPACREQPSEIDDNLLEASARDSPEPEQALEQMWVSREIMALPPKYREVILLRYYQELTVKEIAHILRLPATTVGGRLKRAKAMLKSRLKEEYFDEIQRPD